MLLNKLLKISHRSSFLVSNHLLFFHSNKLFLWVYIVLCFFGRATLLFAFQLLQPTSFYTPFRAIIIGSCRQSTQMEFASNWCIQIVIVFYKFVSQVDLHMIWTTQNHILLFYWHIKILYPYSNGGNLLTSSKYHDKIMKIEL